VTVKKDWGYGVTTQSKLCPPAEHDYMPPVVATAHVRYGFLGLQRSQSASLVSVCRKCGDTLERVLDIKLEYGLIGE
jgi:hypothetical protein